ncbi:MAG: Oxidoreductase [Ignavibacteriae bacterium]|nr:MAG: Oxidoreductase [Ignavibacteriota bacterium]
MQYRFLGNSGIKVSEICFGTMTFGGTGYWKNIGATNQTDANELVELAIENGINFFDTADIYSNGLAEEILGKALGTKRQNVIIATKVYGRMSNGLNDIGLSRHHIIEACNASLKRLKTDYIDLYQVHNFDPFTPLEETLNALTELVKSGKVRYIGCSNFTGWQLMKAIAISEKYNLEKFITLQAYYSLMARELELELIPLCKDQKIGILPWSPLAGGFLTGKYRRNMPRPEGARRSNPENQFLQFDEEKGYDIIEVLDGVAKNHNATVSQVALRFLLEKHVVSSIIIGVRTKAHLLDNIRASNWKLTDEEIKSIDMISRPPRLYPYWMQEFVQRDR